MRKLFPLLAVVLLVSYCEQPARQTASSLIDTVAMARYIQDLASDEFMGRKPFTAGETKTINYLKDEFIQLGLEPGNGESYFQEVPLVEITANPSETMTISGGGDLELKLYEDYVVYTQKPVASVNLDQSELVFAGFGIVAPEYNWNDYDGLDVRGKTVVVLVNDPGFGTGDSTFFKGETMTYYGRWTYKYEEAARQGATGVLIIHETIPAGYPWLVVRNSWSGASLNLDTDAPLCDVQGWITRDAAIKLFEASAQDMIGFVEKSRTPDFKPVDLGLNVSVSVDNDVKRDMSQNVVAKITGSKNPEEVIIYSAHWDHFGVGPDQDGDSIYNGAHDNASGTALMMGIAKAFAQSPQPKRTVVFLAVTAEEQGLLGSAYYAADPIYDPMKTVANLNIDGVAAYGAMKDLTVIGYGQSELEEMAERLAAVQDRYIIADPDPGKGYFFRSDHFSFAKIGIPAFYASGSYEAVKGGKERVAIETQDYLAYRYHKPSDEYNEDWQYGGMYQDAELYYQIGVELSNSDLWPSWKEGSEFKAIRERD